MKGNIDRATILDRIAVAAIMIVAVLILAMFELAALSAVQPLPPATTVALSSHADLHMLKLDRHVPTRTTAAARH